MSDNSSPFPCVLCICPDLYDDMRSFFKLLPPPFSHTMMVGPLPNILPLWTSCCKPLGCGRDCGTILPRAISWSSANFHPCIWRNTSSGEYSHEYFCRFFILTTLYRHAKNVEWLSARNAKRLIFFTCPSRLKLELGTHHHLPHHRRPLLLLSPAIVIILHQQQIRGPPFSPGQGQMRLTNIAWGLPFDISLLLTSSLNQLVFSVPWSPRIPLVNPNTSVIFSKRSRTVVARLLLLARMPRRNRENPSMNAWMTIFHRMRPINFKIKKYYEHKDLPCWLLWCHRALGPGTEYTLRSMCRLPTSLFGGPITLK